MTKFYKATDSTGAVHLRSTQDRIYTHVVVFPGTRGSRGQRIPDVTWAGRPDLAQKAARDGSEIAEAVEITAQEYRALKKEIRS